MKKKRGAGILLPISSLPSPYGIGTLGAEAYAFVDQLAEAKQSYWQVLPVGPTSFGDSPYQSFSAFAGNPYFIDLDTLKEDGLLLSEEIEEQYWGDDVSEVDYAALYEARFEVLHKAYARSDHKMQEDYQAFLAKSSYWLEDYSFYMALKFHFHGQEWSLWEDGLKFRHKETLRKFEDLLAEEIYKQMAKDGTDHVWEDLRTIPREELMEHFPNIVEHCREMGYDVTKECIPVVPAQHYFMGGVWVDHESHTSMERLYAVGETACNGVHGKNRLASNSLLESLVFAKRAAKQMSEQKEKISTAPELFAAIDRSIYADAAALASRYHEYVREAIIAADAKMQQVQDARTKATVAFRKQCAQVG